MTITVSVDKIKHEDILKILEYYNTYKEDNEELLEILNRAEGGFKIKITSKINEDCDENDKIYQLRWHKKSLITKLYTIGFKEKQEFLLFQYLFNVLGENNVIYTIK